MSCEHEEWRGMAFAMTNQLRNSVSAFLRGECGELHFQEQFATGGAGSGEAVVDPLGSQGALVLAADGRFLLAVNAGDNTVSSFRLRCGCAELASVVPSGGIRPMSIAVHRDLVYVVNMGGGGIAANLSGFRLERDGTLVPIPNSITPVTMPCCVAFSPDGRFLAVSLRDANLLLTFHVQPDGLLTNPVTSASSGSAPFGMVFRRDDVLLVSEAGPNALSSYRLDPSGALIVISGSVPNGQGATCWVAIRPQGDYAYTSNAATGTVSVYHVDRNGVLTLIESVPTTPHMDGKPIDNAVDPDGKFLYVLNGAQGSISVFAIGCEGHPVLIQIYQNTHLPEVGSQGLAVS